MAMPHEIEFNIEDMINHWINKENPHSSSSSHQGPLFEIAYIFLLSYEFDFDYNLYISFTKDPITLSQMDLKSLQKPGITN